MRAEALLATLREVVGERHVLTDPALRTSYETDWTRRWSGEALAVTRPADAAEVAAVLRACADAGVGVVPQGGNTGLVGGSVPRGREIVLSTTRMRGVDDVDADAGEVTAAGGATLSAVQAAVRPLGWDVGVDLAARDSATVGGMVATNAGGIHVLRHGTMRSRVIGFEAALPDGSVVRRLPGGAKDNTGYDLAGLLAGSEGTLGVVTAVRLRLAPPLRRRATAVIGFEEARGAVRAAGRLRRALGSVLALELFTEEGLALVARHAGVARPFSAPASAYLLVEAASDDEDPTDGLLAAVGALDVGDGNVAVATDTGSRERLWQLRERHTEAMNAEGVPHKLDVSIGLSRYAELVERAPDAVARVDPSARTILYGHVGDGNLHVNVLGPPPDDDRVDEAILALVVKMGGSISAEHGIGVAKVGWLERDRGRAAVAAMRAVKAALDPAGIMNPGVIFPA